MKSGLIPAIHSNSFTSSHYVSHFISPAFAFHSTVRTFREKLRGYGNSGNFDFRAEKTLGLVKRPGDLCNFNSDKYTSSPAYAVSIFFFFHVR